MTGFIVEKRCHADLRDSIKWISRSVHHRTSADVHQRLVAGGIYGMRLRYGCVGVVGVWLVLATSAAAAEGGSRNLLMVMDHGLDQLGKPQSFVSGHLSVKTGGEFRYRLELRDDFNFNDDAFEDDAVRLLRTRLQMDVNAGKTLRAFIQGQDAESFAGSSLNRTNGFIDRLDLRQLFVELTSPMEERAIQLKVGRQELAYGDQRFVGAFDWSNVARVFDAVKASWTPSDWA